MDFILSRIQSQLAWVGTDDSIDWKLYVQASSWGVTLWECFLLLRQYPLYSKAAPPPALAAHLPAETFEKSQRYGKEKARVALFSKLYSQTLDSLLLHVGFYAWCWDTTAIPNLKGGEITHSILFSFLLYFVSSLPSLPISVYSTFVLEERHGFNKTTPALFVTDLLKGWAVAVVLGSPFLAAFLYIFQWAGPERFVPWVMTFMISFQCLMIVLYPTVIQPLFNKLTPLQNGQLRERVEALAGRMKFPLKHLYEIDGSKRSSHSNAYFFGLPWSKHIVIFDTLLQQSSAAQVEAVLAHELGHWFYMHPTKMMLVSQVHIFAILAVFPAFLPSRPFLRSFDFADQAPPTIVAFLLFQMILTPLEAVLGMGMNALSRQFEWEADRFACEVEEKFPDKSAAGEKEDPMSTRLGQALITLHVKNLSTVWVDWLYSAYHHSHPTLTERLKALEAYEPREKKQQ
ncbi:hypothetical protein BDZ89DRAFT_1002065 [Hymenopellis radicata]|nr:hypothetical protein BDZ89DRAFT_1002065 [Hymenopellis radicata]